MAPAKPPFPVPSTRPFQPCAGKPHFELNIRVAGRVQLTSDCGRRRGDSLRETPASGMSSVPEVTASASVMPSAGELYRFLRLAQSAANRSGENRSKQKDQPTTDPGQGTTPDFEHWHKGLRESAVRGFRQRIATVVWWSSGDLCVRRRPRHQPIWRSRSSMSAL
jgi:hypothetical protein